MLEATVPNMVVGLRHAGTNMVILRLALRQWMALALSGIVPMISLVWSTALRLFWFCSDDGDHLRQNTDCFEILSKCLLASEDDIVLLALACLAQLLVFSGPHSIVVCLLHRGLVMYLSDIGRTWSSCRPRARSVDAIACIAFGGERKCSVV